MNNEKFHPLASSSLSTRIQTVERYGFAMVSVATAMTVTHVIEPYVSSNTFDLFQAAVFLSAWHGGLGPGLAAAVMAIGALDYFFIPPLYHLSMGPADFIRLGIFGLVAGVTSSLSARLKQATQDLQAAHGELEDRIVKRTEQLSRANQDLTSEIRQRLDAERAILEISTREQHRLGQDLHDGICQIVAGVRLRVQELKDKLASAGPVEVEIAETIDARLAEALTQADILARGLYPVELETHGLMAALKELVEQIPRLFPVAIQFRCPAPVLMFDGSVATHLYRIAQEAVVNAVKSGKARRVVVRLLQRRAAVVLMIADDGIGFRALKREGMGLRIMQYRARMINGSLRIRSRPGHGTAVQCVVGNNLVRRGDHE